MSSKDVQKSSSEKKILKPGRKPRVGSSWGKNRPLTDSFLFQGLIGAINYLSDNDKQGFNLSHWMKNLGLTPTASSSYKKGTAGKSVPVFEEEIVAAAAVNPKFIGLFFSNIYAQLFPGLTAESAIKTVLENSQLKDGDLNIEKVAMVLEETLSTQDQIFIARQLLLCANKTTHLQTDQLVENDTKFFASY